MKLRKKDSQLEGSLNTKTTFWHVPRKNDYPELVEIEKSGGVSPEGPTVSILQLYVKF